MREDALESALASPRNRFAYGTTDLFALATGYASALTRDHPFVDGNTPVAITAAGVFLELNGQRLEAPEEDAVQAMLALSTRELSEEGFTEWLRSSSRPTGGSPHGTTDVPSRPRHR
jgi:death-on-curing protein